jgi:hypothetical protein
MYSSIATEVVACCFLAARIGAAAVHTRMDKKPSTFHLKGGRGTKLAVKGPLEK